MDACRALLKGNPATAKLSIPHSSLPRTIRKMPSCGENPWFDKILTNPFGVLEALKTNELQSENYLPDT
jgi:hypothetical protein